jgi:predicted transcriptional regulator
VHYLVMQNEAANKKTISFRLEAEKLAALDKLDKGQARGRRFLLNEAVDEAYLNVHYWQIEHIKGGLRQADVGIGSDHKHVRAKWRLSVLQAFL